MMDAHLQTAAELNPLQRLASFGQSVWLDYIRRRLLEGGELERLIREDGLKGVTSNPAIFEKAITGSDDYQAALAGSAEQSGGAEALYERIAVEDIQRAADILRSVYDATQRQDGYVSLEVSPHLAHDTEGTIAAARRLWQIVNRENLMIKVPGTPRGLPAIEALLAEGINVNVTLLFSRDVYAAVAKTYISGVERFAGNGGDASRLASVASFFISRIDTMVDRLIGQRLDTARSGEARAALKRLRGKAAIANGKLTYALYQDIFAGPRWDALATRGARPQRVLWASTSTKNPAYSDVLYVEELIGEQTINTLPPDTLDAFRDHGEPRPSLAENLAEAQAVMQGLAEHGIAMDQVSEDLLAEGLRLFAEAYDQLLAAIAKSGGN